MDEIIRFLEKQDCSIKFDDAIRIMKEQPKPEISFSGLCKSCCVGVVDIVDSTRVTATLTNEEMCEYYRIFLNLMGYIGQKFDAVVVKNIGDSLLYYFPETDECKDKNSLRKVLECSFAMIESHHLINRLMYEYGLPPIHYRVSSDYGKITIAKSHNSDIDLFGSTVNVCTKMNAFALPNHIVIGGDLYQVVRTFNEYGFGIITGYSLGLKLDYPIYSVHRTKK